LDGKSDHRAAFTKFLLRERGPTLKRRRRVQIGWKPKVDEAGQPSEYHTALDAALTTDGDIDRRKGLSKQVWKALECNAGSA
jgi:hypothetical protein